MPLVGGPHTRITNPRWRTTAILEKSKNCYRPLSQPLFKRFWRNLARRCSSTLLTVSTIKNLKFQKSKMAAAANLKSLKIVISGPRFDRFDECLHDDAVRPSWPFARSKIQISKIQDGGDRHLEKSKNRHISAAVKAISTKLGKLMHLSQPALLQREGSIRRERQVLVCCMQVS